MSAANYRGEDDAEAEAAPAVTSGVRARVRRLHCVLTGCEAARDYPACARCGEALYGGHFREFGKLEWFFVLRWRLREFVRKFHRKTCAECGRKFWRGYNTELCSEECFDVWLPF